MRHLFIYFVLIVVLCLSLFYSFTLKLQVNELSLTCSKKNVENEMLSKFTVPNDKLQFTASIAKDKDAFRQNQMFLAYRSWSEGGYADKRTVYQGETIQFFIATEVSSYTCGIFRVRGTQNILMTQIDGLRNNNDIRTGDCRPDRGCKWMPTFKLDIPEVWPSGWYRVQFPIHYEDGVRHIDFVVAEKVPKAPILMILDWTTNVAYNVYGGGSAYLKYDEYGHYKLPNKELPMNYFTKTSFLRPLVVSGTYSQARGNATVNTPRFNPWYEEDFRSWLDLQYKSGEIAFITNDAIGTYGYQYLTYYKCIVMYGLQEYWASEWLVLLKQYVVSGGNIVLGALEFGLGAIRMSDNGNAMEYFRSIKHDPSFNSKKGGATDRALTPDIDQHNLDNFIGTSFRVEHILEAGTASTLQVVNANHWAFEGTNLKNGDSVAEVQGVLHGGHIEMVDGKPCLVSSSIPCSNMEVLAYGSYPSRWHPTNQTYSAISILRHGKGSMFVAPKIFSTENKITQMIIKNVINKLKV